MTLLEFDLDQGPVLASGPAGATGPDGGPGRPAGRSRPLLVLVLVLAAVGGAVLRTVSLGSDEPPPLPVSALLSLTGLALTPDPVLQLRLEVSSPAGDVEVDRVRLTGGGAGDVGLPLAAAAPSGRPALFDLEVPLLCRAAGTGALTGSVRVRDPQARLWREVPVVVAGTLHGGDGACGLAATQDLPPGWQDPLQVDGVRTTGDLLEFSVRGLGGLDRVQGVSVDGTLLSQAPGDRPTGRVAVLAPQPDCSRPDTRPSVPTGVRVTLTGPSGLVTRYAAIGPVLAQWLRASRARQCEPGGTTSAGAVG